MLAKWIKYMKSSKPKSEDTEEIIDVKEIVNTMVAIAIGMSVMRIVLNSFHIEKVKLHGRFGTWPNSIFTKRYYAAKSVCEVF